MECEAIAAAHGCQSPALLVEMHNLEDPEGFISPEETDLLERTNYGLAFTSPAARPKLARGLLGRDPAWVRSGQEVAKETRPPAESYPRAGEEDGLLMQNIWVLRNHQKRAERAAWRLPLVYGIVPGLPSQKFDFHELRMDYKRQVAAAVKAAALSSCDCLLIGCAGGIPSLGKGGLSPELGAKIWAEVLLESPASQNIGKDHCALAQYFKLIIFCLAGASDGHRRSGAMIALSKAFNI